MDSAKRLRAPLCATSSACRRGRHRWRGPPNLESFNRSSPMKAVAYQQARPISHPESRCSTCLDLPEPKPGPRDLLVEVRAVAVNPVDEDPRPLGSPHPATGKCWAGMRAGRARHRFPTSPVQAGRSRLGCEVAAARGKQLATSSRFWSGERLVGSAPRSLDFAAARRLCRSRHHRLGSAVSIATDHARQAPSRAIDRDLRPPRSQRRGVRSHHDLQLARRLSGLTVIGHGIRLAIDTAPRARELGRTIISITRSRSARKLERIGARAPNFVVSLTHTEQHFKYIAAAIAAKAGFGLIDDPLPEPDASLLKGKERVTALGSMFTRSTYSTADMIAQHSLLEEVASLVNRRDPHDTRRALRPASMRPIFKGARAAGERQRPAERSCSKGSSQTSANRLAR